MKLPFPLQNQEKVLIVCRRHWIFLWPRVVFEAVIAVVPVVALFLVLHWAGALHGLGFRIAGIVALVWLVFWAVRLWLIKYRYDNDLWTVTDQRLVDSTKSSPFSLRMTAADLVNIVDTEVIRSGIFPTILNYGDIRVETAGEHENIFFPSVPHPADVHALIDKERDRERRAVYQGETAVTQPPPTQAEG
jgi:hypothetical protein